MAALRPFARPGWLLAHLMSVCVPLFLSGCDAGTPASLDADSAEALASGSTSLGPPSELTATAVSASRVDVAWKDNASRETGFQLRRSTTGPTGTFTVLKTTGPDVTTHADEGLTASTQYCYKVRAFTTDNGYTQYSSFSNTACATTEAAPPPPGPKAPSGVDATPTASDAVVVSWVDNSDNEEWFRVEYAESGSGSWTFIGTLLRSGYTSYTLRRVPTEVQRCYRVIALNAQGQSAPSNIDCATPPAAPSGLAAVLADGPAVDLVWRDNSSAEDGYEVRRGSPSVAWGTVANLPPNTTSYRDVSVTIDNSYYYEVRAKKDGGHSSNSNSVDIATGVPKPPARPDLQQLEGYYLGSMWLSWWNDPATVDSIKIERCDKETCAETDFTVIATVAVDGSLMAYKDWGLADWTIYTYRIRATNQAGESEPSLPMQGRTCIDEVDWWSPCFPPLPSDPAAGARVPTKIQPLTVGSSSRPSLPGRRSTPSRVERRP